MNINILKNKYYLGQKVDSEDFYREYKEFTLSYVFLDNLSEDKLLEYVEGIFDDKINNSILQTLHEYIQKYFLKYITSFINISTHYKKQEENTASLNIGISDDGYITGIPIFKESLLDVINIIDKINVLVQNIIIFDILEKNFIEEKQEVTNIVNLILENLQIEIHILDINNNTKKYIDANYNQEIKRLINYYETKKRWDEMYAIYYKEYLEWNMLMNKYSCKIVEIFEDETRKNSFVNYIITKYPEDSKYDGDFDIHIKGIVEDKVYHLKFQYQRYIELVRLFKDDMRASLEKPKPLPLKPTSPIKNIIHKLIPIAKKIISKNSKNKEIVYLLIKFNIRTDLDMNNKLIGFKTKDSIQLRVRRISHNGPESS